MALVQMNFESRYLNNNHEISIILPDMPRDKTPAEFYGSGRKYKVLWLLHVREMRSIRRKDRRGNSFIWFRGRHIRIRSWTR